MLSKTPEQAAVIEASKKNKELRINAYAGGGKTSTLAMVAKELGTKTLMLVFNKSAQQDAISKFPSNVEVRTTHSIAYQAVGHLYMSKLNRPQGRYVNVAGTGSEISQFYGIKPIIGSERVMPAAYIGLLVKCYVGSFESSADQKIGKPCGGHYEEDAAFYGIDEDKISSTIVKFSRLLWKDRVDLTSDVLATHDTYMKLYQLSCPILNYDVIMLDEAQDTSSCTLDIVKRQGDNGAKVILVGDEYQSIYEWRGAINAMNKVDYPSESLSTTFRFGQDLADLANKILGKGSSIKSFEGTSTQVGTDVVDVEKPYTILYRTNAMIIMDAVSMIEKEMSFNLEIDVRDFCKVLESSQALYEGNMRKVKHEDVLCYASWEDFSAEAEAVKGSLMIIKHAVESGACYTIIRTLNKHSNCKDPHVILTTAHKSKGREFDQVILAPDFPSNFNPDGKWVGLSDQERNLLYVGATRAKKALNTNTTAEEIMFHFSKK